MGAARAFIAVSMVLGACGGDDGGGGVTIIRGAPGEVGWLDLTLEGEAIDVADGTPVVVQLGMPDRAPERLGSAALVVEGGAFAVHFPEVWENGLYKKKVLFFDIDADGACGPGDTVLVDWSAAVEDVTMRVSGPDGELWGDFFASSCEEFLAEWPQE